MVYYVVVVIMYSRRHEIGNASATVVSRSKLNRPQKTLIVPGSQISQFDAINILTIFHTVAKIQQRHIFYQILFKIYNTAYLPNN